MVFATSTSTRYSSWKSTTTLSDIHCLVKKRINEDYYKKCFCFLIDKYLYNIYNKQSGCSSVFTVEFEHVFVYRVNNIPCTKNTLTMGKKDLKNNQLGCCSPIFICKFDPMLTQMVRLCMNFLHKEKP